MNDTEKRDCDITVICPVCSTKIYQPPKNTDPRDTVLVLIACASCMKRNSTMYDCTFYDKHGRELWAGTEDGLKGPK